MVPPKKVLCYSEIVPKHSKRCTFLYRHLNCVINNSANEDDAKEVDAGFECGIGVENYNDLKEGDILEVIEMKEVIKTLEG